MEPTCIHARLPPVWHLGRYVPKVGAVWLPPCSYGDEIKEALHTFVGDIEQVPPKFSAIKIDGQRAYALAREGEDVTLSARPLYVDSLFLNEQPDADHAILEMVCGKGGYVRSIARDLGAKLGCYGHVQWLRRTWSGPFDLDQAISLETIEKLES